MDTKQATHAHNSVKRPIDLSVYALFEQDCISFEGTPLPEGVANSLCGPMADSPAARRLQLFIASCAEGGLSNKRLLGIFCEWAESLDQRLSDVTPDTRQERIYRNGLRRAIELSKTRIESSRDADAGSIRRLFLEIEDLSSQMGSDWDTGHPAVYTGWTLLMVAQRRSAESMRLDEAWGHAAAILGSIALVCPNEELLEEALDACADIAYSEVIGPLCAGNERPKKSSSAANINAGTRRSDRTKKRHATRRRSAGAAPEKKRGALS